MNKATQNQKVLEYMKQHGSIDQWRAMNELRIMRLGARIWDLKAAGISIVTVMRRKVNEDGSFTRWAEYSLGDAA